MTRRLLILTLYYPPDLSAGSFRATALVEALRALQPDLAIDVITSLPNRYHSFAASAPATETDGSVTVRRIPMPAHRSDTLTQAAAYSRFAWRASRVASERRYDLIFATSSRLMTAALGSWVARRSGAVLYLDIRDLFFDTMSDILSRPVAVVLGPILSALEGWTMRRASHVNLVSPGFGPYFQRRYPVLPLSFFTNGIDDEFIVPSATAQPALGEQSVTILYAGNMGEGQGLHLIIPSLAAQLAGRARFRLIGDGGRRAQLVQALERADVSNVEVVPPMPRARLISEYMAADVLFLHLNDYQAFTRVLPSKIFEYAALGKPIWAGVAGYAAEFLRSEVTNAAVFAPCDAAAGLEAWGTLDLRFTPRDCFVRKYARRDIMRGFAADVVAHMPPVEQ
jgi:glycosyltransferase involved in cell wall biosynthesis